jgi:hypothetical protein
VLKEYKEKYEFHSGLVGHGLLTLQQGPHSHSVHPSLLPDFQVASCVPEETLSQRSHLEPGIWY